jgi:hypothetical protein
LDTPACSAIAATTSALPAIAFSVLYFTTPA